jgi:hypothetical protein
MINSRRLVLACGAATLATLACVPNGASSPHQAIGTNAEALRAAFNANVGKVRVVMLVSPT